MGFFNFFDKQKPIIQEIPLPGSSNGKYNTFSTPFNKIGKGNLSLPKVDRYYTQNGIVRFGDDNLYPQLLDQMYYTSPIHGAIIDFMTTNVIGNGFKWDVEPTSGIDKVTLIQFERRYKLNKLIKELTRNYIMHRRMDVIVYKKGKNLNFVRVEPAKVRNSIFDKYATSVDWSRGMFEVKEYKKFNQNCGDGEYLLEYCDNTPGQDIYPIPRYNSILNWCYLDGEIPFLHKSAIQNSAFPSIIVRRPKAFSSPEEVETFREGLMSTKGSSGAGNILVMAADGFDSIPEVTQLQAAVTDKQFEITSREIKDQICFAHSINPSIIGIKVSGSLGNTEELKMSYAIFEKDIIKDIRQTVVDFVNELIFISGISNTISIDYDKITDGGDGLVNSETELSSDVKGETKTQVNDNLKGLSASENMDMIRIIRDYTKGKISEMLAVTRLGSYGLSEDEIKKILEIK